MANQPQTKTDPSKEDEKQLKKLLDSYTAVAKHKLGRAPTLEDLTKMLTEPAGTDQIPGSANEMPVAAEPGMQRTYDAGPQSQPVKGKEVVQGQKATEPVEKASAPEPGLEHDPAEPKILHMKVYYGMTGDEGARQPDPHKILFYEDPLDKRWFDTSAEAWFDQKPSIVDNLPSRPMQSHEKDVIAAIAHGVMSPEDYDALDKHNFIGPTPKRLWQTMSRIRNLNDELTKSAAPVTDQHEDLGPVDESLTAGENVGGGVDVAGDFLNTTGGDRSGLDSDQLDLAGDNVLMQIIEAACGALASDMDYRIRQIVREELAALGLAGEPAGEAEQSVPGTGAEPT